MGNGVVIMCLYSTASITHPSTYRHIPLQGAWGLIGGDVPGPPLQWEEPEDISNPSAGYGYKTDNEEENNIFFFHTDPLGSTAYMTNKNGETCQFISYMPYGEAIIDEHNTDYENPFKFTGMELDPITGLYDHGARQRDPIYLNWLNPDPLTEKYPGVSPWSYCHANPINRKDPNGMDDYGVDREGYTFVIKETEDKYDRLVAGVRNKMGKDGNYKGVRLDKEGNYKNNILEIHKNVMKSKYQNEYGDRYTFFDKQDATDYFEFMANNTDVEWAQYGLESMSGTQMNYISTSHEMNSERMGSFVLNSINPQDYILKYHTHSHPFDHYATYKYNYSPSDNDDRFKIEVLSRFKGNSTFNIYNRGKYYAY